MVNPNHKYLYSFTKGKVILTCAAPHCGATSKKHPTPQSALKELEDRGHE